MGNSLCEVVQVEADFVKVDGQKGQINAGIRKLVYLQNPQLNKNTFNDSSSDELKKNLLAERFNAKNSFKEDKQVISSFSKIFSKIDMEQKQAAPPLQREKNKEKYPQSQNTAKYSQTAETFSKSNSVSFFMLQSILSEEMFFLIQLYDPRFFKKYMKKQISFTPSEKGYFQFHLTESYGIFLNKNYFYEGNFIKDQLGQVLPSLTGSYITPDGKYVGQFKEGCPNGKGKFYQYMWKELDHENDHNQENKNDFQSKNGMSLKLDRNHFILAVYDGEWKKGQFIKGTIQNQKIKYSGNVKNGKPNGLGKLLFKKIQTSYQGQFRQGHFHGENNIYQTQKYKYIGGFFKGKKNGKGILQVKQKQQKNRKLQKLLPEKYEGMWQNDRFILYQNLYSRKK